MNDPRPATYVLGHSQQELERLSFQASLIDPITRGFLVDAGIVAGMRVLDVGSGAGDVAILAAGLVGDEGEVVGIDRVPVALATARARAAALSLRNVSFVEGDVGSTSFEQPFDAIIGRYVLMFQRDPAALLRNISRHARPGGVIVFHELDWGAAWAFPPSPTYDASCRRVVECFALAGTEPRMGLKLHTTFVSAGLPAPSMSLSARVGGGERSRDSANLLAGVTGTLLAEMERQGVATADEVGIETLADRIIREATASGSVLVSRSEIGAWTRVPSAG
jgi:SAM-dependent methyltransferase